MTNLKATKRALLSSIIALIICFTMLLGTTYAWFTDSVVSTGNKIVAGTLDVDLYLHNPNGSVEITNESAPIFGNEDSLVAQNNPADSLWEPGKTQTVYLSIVNNGTLALKYRVGIEVSEVTKNLNEVVSYIITPDAQYGAIDSRDDLDWTTGKNVVVGINVDSEDVELLPGETHYFALSVHMDEEAGNEYMEGTISFDLKIVATQLAYEEDSFGPEYDADATYPDGSAMAPVNPNGATYLEVRDPATGEALGSANVPADAVANGAQNIKLNVEHNEDYNFSVTAGLATMTYDVSIIGIKSDNVTPIKVQLRGPAGLDPNTVKLYHNDELITYDEYDPEDGDITFYTTSFSPFTIVYDPNSSFVAPDEDESKIPVANVVAAPEFVGEDKIVWGEYGQWSPTEGLDSDLECAFIFSCTETYEQAEQNPYAYWECDFFVELDRDLAANQIFLGGNYGDFGWVGFHNGDVTLSANEELPLLGSVTGDPWTYLDVVFNVGEFTCGVGDVDDALSGATFTVTLRLTNPENPNETIDIAVVKHTFD